MQKSTLPEKKNIGLQLTGLKPMVNLCNFCTGLHEQKNEARGWIPLKQIMARLLQLFELVTKLLFLYHLLWHPSMCWQYSTVFVGVSLQLHGREVGTKIDNVLLTGWFVFWTVGWLIGKFINELVNSFERAKLLITCLINWINILPESRREIQ